MKKKKNSILIKNCFAHFGKTQKISNKFKFQIYFVICFFMYKKCFANKTTTNINDYDSCNLFENENFAADVIQASARVAKVADFLEFNS